MFLSVLFFLESIYQYNFSNDWIFIFIFWEIFNDWFDYGAGGGWFLDEFVWKRNKVTIAEVCEVVVTLLLSFPAVTNSDALVHLHKDSNFFIFLFIIFIFWLHTVYICLRKFKGISEQVVIVLNDWCCACVAWVGMEWINLYENFSVP